uniref:Zinc finger PHD-type domain-containing protein n=1 Tax=Octopus bimaculoides TaxID=37653 RepID=A0A0L8G1Z0_OCTBM
MLLQRKNSQSVDYSFSAMPRNAFKAPKTKRSPAKPEPEPTVSPPAKLRPPPPPSSSALMLSAFITLATHLSILEGESPSLYISIYRYSPLLFTYMCMYVCSEHCLFYNAVSRIYIYIFVCLSSLRLNVIYLLIYPFILFHSMLTPPLLHTHERERERMRDLLPFDLATCTKSLSNHTILSRKCDVLSEIVILDWDVVCLGEGRQDGRGRQPLFIIIIDHSFLSVSSVFKRVFCDSKKVHLFFRAGLATTFDLSRLLRVCKTWSKLGVMASYTSVAKKRRTKDDFYTFCTIVLSYTQYESLKREELRQQNNISPVGSGGSAADSYSSDSTASLSSGSLQESIPETLQENLPIDRVQENITSTLTTTTTTTTTTSTVVNCRLSERITHQQTTPKQQFLKQQPPKHPMFLKQQQQQQQPQHIKQHSKLQLLKQQQQQQQQQHTKQLVQPKQQLVPRQLTKPQNQATLVQATVLPSLSSIPQQNSNRLDGFYHRNVEADLSSLSSSSSSSPSSSSHQQYSSHQKQKLHQQVLVDDKVKQLEGVQLQKREECTPCEHHLKTHIKQEEKPSLDELQSNSVVSQNSVTSVKVEKEVFEPVVEEKKANTHFSKLDLHAHENNTDSLAESCGESIHSNSSSPDAIESDDESWDLITCHCLKPYAGRPMIECSECSTWIHLSCAKIRKSNIPETFVCQQCREAKFTTRKSNRIRTESKRISI